MNPPEMAPWNLALRFGIEIAALVSLGIGAWAVTSGAARWVAVIVIPILAAAAWGTFNVLGDPSRSGEAPVEVAGWVRLGIELLILGGGVAALAVAERRNLAIGLGALIAFHYVMSGSRLQWLLKQ